MSVPAFGASSMILNVGLLNDSSGDLVNSGTWILVLKDTESAFLPGGIPASSVSPNSHLTLANTAPVAQDFSGLALNLGIQINDSTIRAIGSITDPSNMDVGAGYALSGAIEFGDGEENRAYGFYWFPGIAPGSTLPTSGTFEIGGFFQSSPSEFAAYGTFSPPPAIDNDPTFFDSSNFNAITVTAIPEPTTALLVTLGLLGLLRRSRKA